MRVRVPCPAKVNTFLSVGPPAIGGYHPIRTLFRAVSWFDELVVEVADRDEVFCDWADLPPENTVTKVLRLYRELYPLKPLKISLQKRIPSEAGLGGGSSNAAGVLRAIVAITGVPLGSHHWDVAAAVGKDVPFFLVGGKARGEGFGEVLTPLDDEPARWLLLAKPPIGISTASAYASLDAMPREWREFQTDDWELYNDFERVAPCLCGEIIERLRVHGASGAGMSGSGSAVFGVFDSEATASRARDGLINEFRDTLFHVAHTLTRSESLAIEVLE